jgi:hypothetical protein
VFFGELVNDVPRCDPKPDKICEEEKGIDEDENLEDDMGAERSSGRWALAGGGDASRDFSNQ